MKHFNRRIAVMIVCAGITAGCSAQDSRQPSTSFPADRQHDAEQLALTLYATHLDDGSWTRRDASPCARLPHHSFSFYTQTPTNGAISRFLAVYDLNATPAHSTKPWHRGVLLVRLRSLPAKGLFNGPVDPILLTVFNRVLQDEHAAGRGIPPATRINVDDLAECFLAALDEHPLPVIPSEVPVGLTAPPGAAVGGTVVGGQVIGKMISLVSPAGYTRTANFRFDDDGLITTADILVQYTGR